jgi:hypothetical protein
MIGFYKRATPLGFRLRYDTSLNLCPTVLRRTSAGPLNTNSPDQQEGAIVTSAVTEPEARDRPALTSSDPAGDWLCGWCHNLVANERDRFRYDGQDEFTFANPEGIRFAIITFAPTRGCRQAGAPTFEYTWFPDHAWSFCLCARCRQHLGWFYRGQHEFAGLIKDRIVRAMCVRN